MCPAPPTGHAPRHTPLETPLSSPRPSCWPFHAGHAPSWPRPRPPSCPSSPLWVPYASGHLRPDAGCWSLRAKQQWRLTRAGAGLWPPGSASRCDFGGSLHVWSLSVNLKWPCDKARRPPLFHFVSTNHSRKCSLDLARQKKSSQGEDPPSPLPLPPKSVPVGTATKSSSEGFSFSTPMCEHTSPLPRSAKDCRLGRKEPRTSKNAGFPKGAFCRVQSARRSPAEPGSWCALGAPWGGIMTSGSNSSSAIW